MGKYVPSYYRLIGKLAVPESNVFRWASLMENSKARRVAETRIGGTIISTVFIGIDHNFAGGGVPHIFETAVFGHGDNEVRERCDTWEAAEEMHNRIVEEIRAEVMPLDPPRLVKK